jgi:hypothetical protein
MIYRGELCAVRRRFALQLELSAHRWCMRGAIRSYLRGDRVKLNSVRSTVIACAVVVVDRDVVDDRAVINVGDVDVADVVHVAVVVEVVTVPIAALVTSSDIAVAVIHAAIKTDVAAPVAMVEAVSAAHKSPIRRRP